MTLSDISETIVRKGLRGAGVWPSVLVAAGAPEKELAGSRRYESRFPEILAILLLCCVPAGAQLSTPAPDPLARIRDAAKTNGEACSATGETLCEQVAPKIIANAQGESPLAENLRRLTKTFKDRKSQIIEDAPAVTWAVAAFRDAGVTVHTEKYDLPAEKSGGKPTEQENVIAEIRGREKPDEWVILAALFDSGHVPLSVEEACNAALVIEAARDIQLTGVRPRRSIRFVLFGGPSDAPPASRKNDDQPIAGSWAYLRAHRDDLDRISAAIFFDASPSHVSGFDLNGRHDLEPGVREAVKPVSSMGVADLRFDAPLETDSLDFLLEGIPSVTATSTDAPSSSGSAATASSLSNVDLKELKRNTAIAAVTAFGVAERAEPLGPRQSRAEIDSLLTATGLAAQMKTANIWPQWASGQRGRVP